MFKTMNCGELRSRHIGQTVTLAGWIHRKRNHGNLIFIDLRDASGLVQVVFDPETGSADLHQLAQDLRGEWVVSVKGIVTGRPKGTFNPEIDTGEIEVSASDMSVLNMSLTPPFYVNEDSDVDENLRLQYRYIDLRRDGMREAMVIRHRIVKYIRDFLDRRKFLEIETPILIKSTPEGARDFVVPSRLNPGNFYALPQSPQQLKQLLMVSGFERYFQIARCFRDEDSRADRQPEHTQLDLEMSFVEQEDILELIEELFSSLVEDIFPNRRVMKPFPRLNYRDAMRLYGSDKPDLRFGLELADVSDIAREIKFKPFSEVLATGGIVKGLLAPGCGSYSRRQIEGLASFAKDGGVNGLFTVALIGEPASLVELKQEQIRSSISRFVTVEQVKEIAWRTNAEVGDLIIMVAGEDKATNRVLGALRHEIGERLRLADPDLLAFAFIVDFPLFEWDDVENGWDAMHHPFTMPKEGFEQYLDTDPGKVLAKCYDLICNGFEMASGSIRVHRRELQEKIFRIMGYSEKEVIRRFGQLLMALDYGAPPHGGIAPGIDRLVMVLLGRNTIRDVIAFPKTQSAADPLFGAPSPIDQNQLDQLHLKVSHRPAVEK